jgi:hypothetical protein
MDSRRFDALAKSLSRTDTRRRIARLLAALPLGVALSALVGNERDITAKDDDHGSSHRHRRRKAKHRHQTGNNKEHRKGKRNGKRKGSKKCRPEPPAETCAGKCATVINTCGDPVDCGPCTCGTGCPQCQTCNPATGLCDPVANGTGCDDENACTQTDTCQNGVCVGANPLADGQCCGAPNAGTRCQRGTCVPATATVAECQGRCGTGSVSICGQAANCPNCIRCGCAGFCPDTVGPLGPGAYCVESDTGDFCPPFGSTPCTTPNTICCDGTCYSICTTERDV